MAFVPLIYMQLHCIQHHEAWECHCTETACLMFLAQLARWPAMQQFCAIQLTVNCNLLYNMRLGIGVIHGCPHLLCFYVAHACYEGLVRLLRSSMSTYSYMHVGSCFWCLQNASFGTKQAGCNRAAPIKSAYLIKGEPGMLALVLLDRLVWIMSLSSPTTTCYQCQKQRTMKLYKVL